LSGQSTAQAGTQRSGQTTTAEPSSPIDELRKLAARGKQAAKRAEARRKARTALQAELPTMHSNKLAPLEQQTDRARKLAEQGHWKAALNAVRGATKQNASDPNLMALEAWCIFNTPQGDRERQLKVCHDRLTLVITIDPTNADAHYYIGRIAEERGDTRRALRCYRDAAQLDRGHKEAVLRMQELQPFAMKTSSRDRKSAHHRVRH